MLMLSHLLCFRVMDRSGQQARLFDLAVLLEGDYPPVTGLLLAAPGGSHAALAWDQVERVDRRARQVIVSNLEAAQLLTPDSLARTVLLRRDLLDALVLDLVNRRAMRTNDIALAEREGCLWVHAADASVQAVWRRLSGGRFGRVSSKMLYDWKYVEFLRGDPTAVSGGAEYHRRIVRLPPGEIARLSEELPYLHAAELLTLLPDPLAADVLEAMSAARQLQVFEELEQAQALRLLALMAPDIAADLVGRLRPGDARYFLDHLPAARGERIIELLRYTEDSVGGVMTNDVVYAPASLTVAEARTALRERLAEPDFVYFVYVVDDEESRRLRGVLTLRELLVADEAARLAEVMNPYVTTLDPLDAAARAAYRVLSSHLAALPVVGRDGRLLGIMTVDAAVAQVAPQSWASQAPKVFS